MSNSLKSILKNNRTHLYLISAICFIIIFYVIQYGTDRYNSDLVIKNRFQKNFIEQQILLNKKAIDVVEIISDSDISNWPALERTLNTDDILARIFNNDSLIFWNSNQIKNNLINLQKTILDTVIREKTGWYLMHYEKADTFRIFLFKRIKSEYPFENKFLPSVAAADFISSSNIYLTQDLDEAQYKIHGQNENPIVGLNFDPDLNPAIGIILWLFFFFLLAYLMFIIWIGSLYDKFGHNISNKKFLFLFYVIDLIILRFADYYFTYPAILKNSFIFEPKFEILAGMNSIGDLIFTLTLLVAIFYKFNQLAHDGKMNVLPKYKYIQHMLSVFVMWVVTIGAFFIIYRIISGLNINPVLGIQLGEPENILSIFAIILLDVLIFLIARSTIYYALRQPISYIYKVLYISIIALITYLIIPNNYIVVITGFVFIILLVSIVTFLKDTSSFKFLKYLLFLIIFAAANALIINEAEHDAKDVSQEKTANYLIQKNDRNLEMIYADFSNKIISDTLVQLIIENYKVNPESAINEYLKSNYFGTISGTYDIQVTLCNEDELLEIQPEGILISCNEYFSNMILDFGDSTKVAGLYLQNSTPESIYYIGLIRNNMLTNRDIDMNMYIEFYFTYVPEGLGYPELLVDNKTLDYDLSGYAFAKYSDEKLVYKFGDFAYYTDYSAIRNFPSHKFYNYSDYRHLKLVTGDGDTLVISRPTTKMSEKMATFSMLFLLLGLTVILIFTLVFSKEALAFFALSFRTRLQVFFIATISVTILIIAIITTYYAENSNKERLITQLNEKTYSVLIELQHKLGSINSFDEFQLDELQPLLRKFSLVFFSDINVYDPSGKLVASSRPEIFRKGLLSELINPLAFEEIYVDNKLFYTAEEMIGELAYYSSYVPLNLGDNEPIGIVNLPYFARQTEVKKSYYLMIFSFLNLFVIAGILGTFIALFISKLLTKPLVVLQQSLSEIRIDEQNEKIDWVSDDEIGLLIKEYNQMVDKLEQSTELLKHSERESAWREVARQIAHEIKNPLTPMKLNVQYLEKAYNEDDPSLKDKIRTISKSLIQQIDTLDKVAEMFADFAKSNIRKMDRVELLGVIRSTAALFKNDDINISIQHDEDAYYTKAIEKDMVRLFNNLIKNAIQALDNISAGKVDISITQSESHIKVQITDNGKGIDDGFKGKIFQPYFTTKSGGTGLGLAIVNNIVNETGGSISFESSTNGTTFFLKFNRYE